MKIAVVHRSLGLLGGGERVCMALLTILDRTKHHVELRCVYPPPNVKFSNYVGKSSIDRPGQPSAVLDRIRVVRIPVGGSKGNASDPHAAEELELFRAQDADLVIVTDGGFIMAATEARKVLLYCNATLERESEVLKTPWPSSPLKLLPMWRIKAPVKRRLALLRDKKVVIVPNSKSTKLMINGVLGHDRCARVVYPPVNIQHFSALKKYPKENRIVTVARYAPEKNLAEAILIAKQAGCRYDIFGNARDPLQFGYLRSIRRDANKAVHCHVNATDAPLEKAVGSAKVYLHTSRETFGIAVVEAAAAGCIPVVPDNSAHPETVPFRELRYKTTEEAARIVKEAVAGSHDRILPDLARHIQRFSVEKFGSDILRIVEGQHCDSPPF